jgi:pimeloyl-ACP methyl ester carboxylesterase
MGGYAALAAWNLAPERFLALGLIASQAGPDTEEGRQGRYKLANKVAAEGSSAVAAAMIPKLFAAGIAVAPLILAQVREIILNTDRAGIIGSLQGMAVRPDSAALLSKISVPVLILAGDQDQIIAPDKAKAMAAAMKTATLTMVKHAGHMPMLEQPEATTTALRDFLSGISSGLLSG